MPDTNDFFNKIVLEAILNELPFMIFICNENYEIKLANKLFYRKFLMDEKKIDEKKSITLNIKTKEETFIQGADKKLITLNMVDGGSFNATLQKLSIGVENKQIYIGFVTNEDGKIQLSADKLLLTNIKGAFEDKLEQEKELSDMKSRFLSIASHEFRTPLAGILSSLNLINRYFEADQESWKRFKTREKVEKHLDKINESVKNLTTILQKFLSLGNIEKGDIPVKPTRFDLKKTLVLQVAQFQQICKSNQIITYVNKGRKVTVFLDKYLLKNIMNNLLSNAIKFSPENSEIQVSSEIHKNEISIIVKDQGIGIPKSEQNKVFRRFYRAGNTITFEEGTGLGLNIVKKYIELMDGSIKLSSEINKGTTFKITFPIKKA